MLNVNGVWLIILIRLAVKNFYIATFTHWQHTIFIFTEGKKSKKNFLLRTKINKKKCNFCQIKKETITHTLTHKSIKWWSNSNTKLNKHIDDRLVLIDLPCNWEPLPTHLAINAESARETYVGLRLWCVCVWVRLCASVSRNSIFNPELHTRQSTPKLDDKIVWLETIANPHKHTHTTLHRTA